MDTALFSSHSALSLTIVLFGYRFKDVHDYFRAVLKSGEKSSRVLELTEEALEMNPANYTVWHYRWTSGFFFMP